MLTRYRFPLFIAACATVLAAGPASVSAGENHTGDRIRLERLDRGLVAAATAEGVFLSWRLLGRRSPATPRPAWPAPTSTSTATASGSPRSPTAPTTSTPPAPRPPATASPRSCADASATAAPTVTPWADGYSTSRCASRPTASPRPARRTPTRANDMSVGDVDGDGQYEYIVKWDPSNSKDVSQVGYTGPSTSTPTSWTARCCTASTSASTSAPARTTRSSWSTTSTATAGPR